MTPQKLLLTLTSYLVPLISFLLPLPVFAQTATIPTQAQWLDLGMILDSDPTKVTWPSFYEGATPGDIVKHNNTYYLYFIGADDYISQLDNIGPARRSVGVATSQNGINWTPYSGNPILTFTSSGNPEEGAVSIGVYVEAGVFHAYYGTNIAGTPTSASVNANVRYATSTNGLNFTDQGIVLRYNDSSVWGYGDELHAVGAYKLNNTYYAYYVPNGTSVSRTLAVAWGSSPTSLTSSSGVTLNGALIGSGPASIVALNSTTLAYFTTRSSTTQVHTVPTSNPTQASALVQTYTLPGFGKVVYLDLAKNTWFMAYNSWTSTGLRVAPNGSPDTTPPTTPQSLTATAQNAHQLTLNWQPSTDTDTGIAFYEIVRNDTLIGTTTTLTYKDSGLSERTSYTYAVRARNLHNTLGQAAQISFTTPTDTIPAAVTAISSNNLLNQIEISFNEPIDATSAQNPSNYTLNHNLTATDAALVNDTTVRLTTSTQLNNVATTLTVTNIKDRAQIPNTTTNEYLFTSSSLSTLTAYYRLDQNLGSIDSSGNASHAQIKGSPTWDTGRVGTAITLNGADQYLHIPHTPTLNTTFSNSFTLSAWVKPQDTPPYTTASNGAYTVFSGPNIRIHYDNLQRFMIKTNTLSGDPTLTTTGTFTPDVWYHLTLTVDNSARQMRLYLHNQSGTQLANQSVSLPAALKPLPAPQIDSWSINGSHFKLGVNDPYFDYEKNFFKGQLDDVRIYNRVLSSSEVQSLTQITDPTPPTTAPASPTPAPTGDLDGNGLVDILDVLYLITRFFDTNPTADLNNDGRIDIFDFNLLLRQF